MSAQAVEDLSEEEDEVDPRVKEELESLNCASEEINKLETELELARNKFRSLLADSSEHLRQLGKKLGKCVNKARPYYDVLRESKKAESELQRATVKFQRANSLYKAAKETVALAEEGKTTAQGEEDVEFDSAWQEMMNHATMRFMATEAEKRAVEIEHQSRLTVYATVQAKRLALEKDMPRSINKARPYFEMKDRLESRLQQERQSVEDLQRALTASKDRYQGALKNLEQISEEIHHRRKKQARVPLPPRTPGVGAETCSDQSDLPSINLDGGDTQSVASSDLYVDDSDITSLDSRDSFFMDPPSARPSPKHEPTTKPCANHGPFTSPSHVPASPSHGPFSSPSHVTASPNRSVFRQAPQWDQRSTSSSNYSSQSGSFSHISHEERLSLAMQEKAQQRQQQEQEEQEEERRRVAAAEESRLEKLETIERAEKLERRSCSQSPSPAPNQGRHSWNARSISPAPRSASPAPRSTSPASPNATAASPASSRKLFESHARDRIESQRMSRSRAPRSQHFPILEGLSRTNRQLSPKLPHGRPRGHDLLTSRPRSVERGYVKTAGNGYGFAQEINNEQLNRAFDMDKQNARTAKDKGGGGGDSTTTTVLPSTTATATPKVTQNAEGSSKKGSSSSSSKSALAKSEKAKGVVEPKGKSQNEASQSPNRNLSKGPESASRNKTHGKMVNGTDNGDKKSVTVEPYNNDITAVKEVY